MAVATSRNVTVKPGDARLERLFDYTKFHIGVYILAGTTLITVAGSKDQSGFLHGLIKHGWALAGSIGAMLAAGAAGGIIVSRCAIAEHFDEVWRKRIGPWSGQWMTGLWWARLEHAAFWLSVGLFAVAALLPR